MPATAPNTFRDPRGLRIDHVVTSGLFKLDGGAWEVDNNIWIVGDERECFVIDAAHSADPIVAAVEGRKVRGILCTHAHNDHITVAPELSERLDAPVYVHDGDDMLWKATHRHLPHEPMVSGQVFKIAGTDLHVLNTPGHSPGSCCFYAPEAGELFSGDTLFQGGPGATGRSYSSFDTMISSLERSVLMLPAETVVRTGHGDHTTVGAEAPHLEEWIRRGY